MKTKKSYPFIASFAVMALGILALLPVRIYQYFKILEPDTGFYSKIDASVYVMYAVMAIVIVFSVAAAFINRKNLEMKKISLSPVAGGTVFILSALGMISDAVACISDYLKLSGEDVKQSGGIIIILEAVFALISGVYFCALASSYLAKRNNAPKLRTIALALPLWAVMRLLMRFKTTISFINVSDLFIELFAIVFTMLYLLYFAQTMSEVDKGESYYKMFAYGIPAVVFSLACFIPRLILLVIGKDDLLNENYSVEICNLVIPIMIIATLISRSYSLKKAKNSK